MALAAAGLSSLRANDACTTRHEDAAEVASSFSVFPPGHDCTIARSDGAVERHDGGNLVGFLAILGAGAALVAVRRSKLAFCTAAAFGITGLAGLGVSIVPAFGFGWLVGGILGFHVTRSHLAWMTAAAALAAGGVLHIVGVGWIAWAVVLLALIAVPIPYDER
jgi:hypothetical protein